MRTENGRMPRARRAPRGTVPWLAQVLCAAGLVVPSAARATRVQVGADTEVRSIDFEGVHSLPEDRLRALLHTQDRVAAFGFRAFLGKLPLVPGPPRHLFHPRVLQEDVVRLRDRYAASGFLGTRVRYEVEPVGDEDLLDIRFVIEEGTPLQVVDVSIAPADGLASLPVSAQHRKSWADMEKQVRRLAGRRLDVATFVERRDAMRSWWCDHGYSQTTVSGQIARDSLHGEARVRYVIAPGPRNRFGAVDVRGNRSVSEDVVRRELPFQPGDLYSDAALLQGRRNLQQLQIIRSARVEVTAPAAADSILPPAADPSATHSSIPGQPDRELPVTVTVTEAKPRLISGQLGYVTDAGVSTEVMWSHSNFTGGARVLTLSGLAQTGLLALTDNPDLRYRGTVSLQQPHVLRPRASAVVSPFVEYREDAQDRSLEVGSNLTLVYRLPQLFSTSLDYQISTRDIYEFRVEDLAAGNVDLLTFLTQLAEGDFDTLGSRVNTSLVTLSATASTLDEPTNPRSGVYVRPAVQVTTPTAWSSASYWRADCTAFGIAPVTKGVAIVGRLSAGRLFPFGQSLPSADTSPTQSRLALRDASFTAGGSADVRGWDYQMLGPKFPDIRFSQEGDSLTASADGYVAVGGFSRVAFSVELRMPMPLMGPNLGTHVFVDGGRVWTDDSRFSSGGDPYRQEDFFWATGAGMHLSTPVGAIKLSVGYKLNPSLVDLVDSGDFLRAVQEGTPVDQLEKHDSWRWQLHFAIGSSF